MILDFKSDARRPYPGALRARASPSYTATPYFLARADLRSPGADCRDQPSASRGCGSPSRARINRCGLCRSRTGRGLFTGSFSWRAVQPQGFHRAGRQPLHRRHLGQKRRATFHRRCDLGRAPAQGGRHPYRADEFTRICSSPSKAPIYFSDRPTILTM